MSYFSAILVLFCKIYEPQLFLENQNDNWKPEEDPSFDDRLINQWMSVQDTTTEQDRKMLEEVKNRY